MTTPQKQSGLHLKKPPQEVARPPQPAWPCSGCRHKCSRRIAEPDGTCSTKEPSDSATKLPSALWLKARSRPQDSWFCCSGLGMKMMTKIRAICVHAELPLVSESVQPRGSMPAPEKPGASTSCKCAKLLRSTEMLACRGAHHPTFGLQALSYEAVLAHKPSRPVSLRARHKATCVATWSAGPFLSRNMYWP